MPQSLAQVYVHIVFSTKNRFPFLSDETIRNEMNAYIAGIFNRNESPALIVNGTKDHIHILTVLSRKISISKLIGESKRSSSIWIKEKGGKLEKFCWQRGYGAFSLSQSHLSRVKNYIKNQRQHHKQATFKEELRELLDKYNVEFDERYVWD